MHPEVAPRRRSRGLILAGLGLAVLVQAGLSIDAMVDQAATFDEGVHLAAGYSHLALGDHRLNPEQPPFVKLLAAAPLLALQPEFRTSDRAWAEGRQWELGQRFLYEWNEPDPLLFFGRLPIVLLASCLLVAVFVEARRRFGTAAGVAALLLAAFSPDVLAHGSLVTTDLGFALFFFLSASAFARLLERPSARRVASAGMATGAAFATKFSAPILLPVLALLGLHSALRGRALPDAPAAGFRRSGVALAAVGAVALFCLWMMYGFRDVISPEPAIDASRHATLEAGGGGLLQASLRAALPVLPDDYARGLLFVMQHSVARPTFLLGEISRVGFPHYFLVTFLLKTPLPLLLLALLALVRAPRLAGRDAAFVWGPLLVYALFAATRGLQIGHRHLLPLYPFLFVACGEAADSLLRARRAAGLVLVAALATWYAGGTLRQHPHHLAYFNELGGGSGEGWHLLVDSNLDWGQDLKRLATWMREHEVAHLKLSYFGSAPPEAYGIAAERLPGESAPHATWVSRDVQPGDVVAISATNLWGVYLAPEDRALMDRFRRQQPIARVGYSILVYRADFSWPPR